MRTNDNGGSAAAAASGNVRQLRHIRCLRILAIFLTLIAAASMAFSKETKQSYSYNSLTGRSTYFSISVKATDNSAFVYFIVGNVLVFVWSVVLTVLSCIKNYGSRLLLPVAIIDLVMLIILATTNTAATVIEKVAWQGNSHYGWGKFCNYTKNFCGIVVATNVISWLATMIYFAIVVLYIVIIHRRTK
ncbi:CASP-like protein 1E1 [Phalaenopsis equestris]|uniref:CASP-like protein 1E1 n=1 Tax=Phalaenopsis equestris TaxID=78828 RepID=UPI0009E4DFE7|nr:CASP-like protein 1E1 [Phalaenopsis equestris]